MLLRTSLLTVASSRLCDADDSVVLLLGWKMLLMILHSDREASRILRRTWCEVWPRAIWSHLFWECLGSHCVLLLLRPHLIPHDPTGSEFLCSTLLPSMSYLLEKNEHFSQIVISPQRVLVSKIRKAVCYLSVFIIFYTLPLNDFLASYKRVPWKNTILMSY